MLTCPSRLRPPQQTLQPRALNSRYFQKPALEARAGRLQVWPPVRFASWLTDGRCLLCGSLAGGRELSFRGLHPHDLTPPRGPRALAVGDQRVTLAARSGRRSTTAWCPLHLASVPLTASGLLLPRGWAGCGASADSVSGGRRGSLCTGARVPRRMPPRGPAPVGRGGLSCRRCARRPSRKRLRCGASSSPAGRLPRLLPLCRQHAPRCARSRGKNADAWFHGAGVSAEALRASPTLGFQEDSVDKR